MRTQLEGLVVLACVVTAQTTLAESNAEKGAVNAATEWLRLVDGGKYAESWTSCAEMFKARVAKASWPAMVGDVRKPLGSVVSRKVKSTHYAESLPGAPDGKYVVIEFETVFQHKKSAIETVTPMLDSDGQWHVSGYFVR